MGATEITIQLDADSNGLYVIKVEDNGKDDWEDDDDMLLSLSTFCCQNQTILIGSDKKVRKEITRQNQVK